MPFRIGSGAIFGPLVTVDFRAVIKLSRRWAPGHPRCGPRRARPGTKGVPRSPPAGPRSRRPRPAWPRGSPRCRSCARKHRVRGDPALLQLLRQRLHQRVEAQLGRGVGRGPGIELHGAARRDEEEPARPRSLEVRNRVLGREERGDEIQLQHPRSAFSSRDSTSCPPHTRRPGGAARGDPEALGGLVDGAAHGSSWVTSHSKPRREPPFVGPGCARSSADHSSFDR